MNKRNFCLNALSRRVIVLTASFCISLGTPVLKAQRIFDNNSFRAPLNLPTDGNSPRYLASGDLNGDGKPDIVVSNTESNSITIFPNASAVGSISFAPKIVLPTVPATGATSGVTVKDLDGDGKPDIIVANAVDRSLTIYHNTTTDAASVTFTSSSITLGGILYPFATVVSDFNGDGKPEIAVSTGANSIVSNIVILPNLSTPGQMSFGPAQVFECGPANSIANFFDASDLNADGKPDLAITVGNNGKLSVMLNTSPAGGQLAFTDPVFFDNGAQPKGLKIADMDSDGKPDIVVSQANSLVVFRNNYTGSGPFTLDTPVPIGYANFGLDIADLDNDSKPDVISSAIVNSAVYVSRNKSVPGQINASSFNAQITLNTGQTYTHQVIAADLDGDGKPDLVAANQISHSISIFRNTIDITAPAAPAALTARPGSTQIVLSWNAGTEPDLVSYKVYGGTSTDPATLLGTVDAPTRKFTVRGLTNGTKYYFRVSAVDNVNNEGTPSANASATPVFPPAITAFSPLSGPVGTPVVITGTNFNSDASSNAVFFGSVKAAIISATEDRLEVSVPSGATHEPITVINTASDLMASSTHAFNITFNNAKGQPFENGKTFSPQVTFEAGGGQASEIRIADLDGDGKNDIIVGSGSVSRFALYRNTSSAGGFNTSTLERIILETPGMQTSRYALGDVDVDGRPDLLVPYGARLYVFRNTSATGNISFGAPEEFLIGSFTYGLEVADVDGDGKPDLVGGSSQGGYTTLEILRNISDGAGTLDFAAPVYLNNQSFDLLSVRDLDGDNKPDIVASGGSGIYIYRNRCVPGKIEPGSFDAPLVQADNYGVRDLTTGDIDGDGKPEIAFNGYPGRLVSVLKNNSSAGTFSFTQTDLTAATGTLWSISINDIDGDSKADLVVTSDVSPQLSLFRNNGTPGNISFENAEGFVTGASRPGITGDLDNDGKPDLVMAGGNSLYIARNNIIIKEDQTITFAPSRTVTYGDADFPAGATSTNSTIPVTYKGNNDQVATVSSDGTVHIVKPGKVSITASQAGSDLYHPATDVVQELTVAKAAQTITFAATRTIPFNTPDFEPGAVSNNPGIPVVYLSDDPATAAIVNGKIHLLKPGSVTIRATQAGNDYYEAAPEVVQVLTIGKLSQQITFAGTRTEVFGTPDFEPGAQSSNSTIPVGYASADPAIATIVNGKVHIVKAGTVKITASQPGNEFYEAAASIEQMLTIAKADQTIAFAAIPDKYEGDADYDPGAVASSGLTVSYHSDNPAVAAIVNGKIRLQGNGTANITASQPGNENYNPAPSVSQSIRVTYFQAEITPDGPLNFCEGQNVTFTASDASSYRWLKDGQAINGQSGKTLKVTQSGNYTAELTFTNGLLKTTSAKTVTVSSVSATISSPSGTEITRGTTLTLEAAGGVTFNWEDAPGIIGARNGASLTIQPQQTTVYRVNVSNNLGCGAIAEITITVRDKEPEPPQNPVITAGNIITPNADGINDTWTIKNIELYKGNQVRIFDRAGRLLYYKKGYANDWDGTYNGSPLAEDTYYYILDPGDGKTVLRGFITLVRDGR